MLVHRGARRRGVAEALMRAAEVAAAEAGKNLLVLDTSSADAKRLYDRLGWQRVSMIPGYALWPAEGLVDTTIFYKKLCCGRSLLLVCRTTITLSPWPDFAAVLACLRTS